MKENISKKHQKMYMEVARTIGKFGTCDRARVGAVIVKNGCIIGTGYNGSARGDDHCDVVGHLVDNGHCIRTVHAEENSILNAAKNGVSTLGSSIFCTHLPCYRCCQRIVNAGISVVYYGEAYGANDVNRERLIKKVGLELYKI